MTRENIIRMARDAGAEFDLGEPHGDMVKVLERFAALVAAAKEAEHKEAMRYDIHSCGPTCKRYACVAIREAVAAEREACAKVCDPYTHGQWFADAIRARGQA